MNVPQPLPLAALLVFASSVAPAAQADVRTFRTPSFEGYRLDYCKSSGSECGERVATAWCVTQGFEYASDWGLERDIGALQPTISVDNSRVCQGDRCDGFTAIWEQVEFNAATNEALNRIHFVMSDGARLECAFEYDYRLWTPAELREALLETGFRDGRVFRKNIVNQSQMAVEECAFASVPDWWNAYVVGYR